MKKKDSFRVWCFCLFIGLFPILVVAQDPSPDITRHKVFGGQYNDQSIPHQLYREPDGGYIFLAYTASANSGDVQGGYNSDPACPDGCYLLHDIWIVKLDAQLHIVWQKVFGSVGDDILLSSSRTPAGDLVLICWIGGRRGDFEGVTDPMGEWKVVLTNSGAIKSKSRFSYREHLAVTLEGDYILGTQRIDSSLLCATDSISKKDTKFTVIKTDANDNLKWKTCIKSNVHMEVRALKATSDGGCILTGGWHKPNPAGGYNLIDPRVVKIDRNGNISWEKTISQDHSMLGSSLTSTADGGYLVSVHNLEMPDMKLVKLNAAGDIEWQRSYAMEGYQQIFSVIQLKDGNYALVGTSNTNTRSYDMWIVKTDPNGNVMWQKNIGGTQDEWGSELVEKEEGHLLVYGRSHSSDGDLAGMPSRKSDIYIGEITEFKGIVGRSYLDHNKNLRHDQGEPNFDAIKITATSGNNILATYPSNGIYRIPADTGVYTVTGITNQPDYFTIASPATTVRVAGSFTADTLNFAVSSNNEHAEASVTLFPLTPARPGFTVQYKAVIKNEASSVLNGGRLVFFKDSRLSFVSAVPNQTYQQGDSIVWNIGSIHPLDSAELLINCRLMVSPDLQLGDSLLVKALFEFNGDDEDSLDNTYFVRHLVTGSFDPNDKTESHGGVMNLEEARAGEYLDYLIRFQNTGNDTAFTIVVRDTLSDFLDGSSLQTLAASHPYTLSVINQKYVKFHFADIRLVDSIHNEPMSHGYLLFRIRTKPSVELNDVIKNRAAIYFDHNLPVITNEQITTIVDDCTGSNSGLPVVKLSADQYQITVPGSVIVVTANVSTSSTSNPLYVFSKNHLFTSILQQGSSNELRVDENDLESGVNTIYVKMQQVDACGRTVEDTDSISLEKRTVSSGIIDPAFPDRRIHIQQNPVPSNIIVRGLPAGKNYVIRVTNLQGKTVLAQPVSGQDQIVLPSIQLTAGVYFVTIYDGSLLKLKGVIKPIRLYISAR